MSDTQTNGEPARSPNAALANLVVRVMREYTGRGPTKGRAYVQDDLVVVVLEDTLTKAERTLVQNGEAQLVLTNRRALQRSMREDLVAGVEEILGRDVIAFLSDNHIDPDLAVESFVLSRAA